MSENKSDNNNKNTNDLLYNINKKINELSHYYINQKEFACKIITKFNNSINNIEIVNIHQYLYQISSVLNVKYPILSSVYRNNSSALIGSSILVVAYPLLKIGRRTAFFGATFIGLSSLGFVKLLSFKYDYPEPVTNEELKKAIVKSTIERLTKWY